MKAMENLPLLHERTDAWVVNTMAEEIQLRNTEYALCGIDDDAEVLKMGEEET